MIKQHNNITVVGIVLNGKLQMGVSVKSAKPDTIEVPGLSQQIAEGRAEHRPFAEIPLEKTTKPYINTVFEASASTIISHLEKTPIKTWQQKKLPRIA